MVTFTGGIKVPQGKFSVKNNLPPTWTTPEGSIGEFDEDSSVNFQFEASDPEDDPITFSLVSGSLPSGLSLNSSGLLSGTAPTVSSNETSNFTLRITANLATDDRAFSMIIANLVPPTVSGLAVWMDASDSNSITLDGTQVDQWDDKGGSTLTSFIPDGGREPFIVLDAQNGKNAIRGSTSDNLIGAAAGDHNNIWVGGGYIIFASTATGSFIGEILNKQSGAFANGWRVQAQALSGNAIKLSLGINFVANEQWNMTNFDLPNDVPTVVEIEYTGVLAVAPIFRVNGVSKAVTRVGTGSGSIADDSANVLRINNSPGNNQGWANEIYEIIIYNEIPSSGDQTILRNYLTTKWDI